MTKLRKAPASALFLMELIFSVLFFSIAGAVCVNLFVQAHLISERAHARNEAVEHCSSVMEVVRVSGSTADIKACLSALYPSGEWRDGCFYVYFNRENVQTSESDAAYTLRLSLEDGGAVLNASCEYFSAVDEPIYSLALTHYQGG